MIKDNSKGQENKAPDTKGGFPAHGHVRKGHGDIIVRKSEKLTTALYLVSDIIPDKEPVKWKLRETSIELLSDITLSGVTNSADRIAYLRIGIKKIEKILGLLDIAWATRMVSEMNASILRDEYMVLRRMAEDDLSSLLGGNISFLPERATPPMYPIDKDEAKLVRADAHAPRNVFPKETPKEHALPEREVRDDSSNTPTKEQPIDLQSLHQRAPLNSSKEMPLDDAPSSLNIVVPTPLPSSDNRIAKDDRRKIILALLKQRPSLTISDIGKSMQGISEKTIQRELIAMMNEGIVARHGEKRWTTYSLI